MKLFYHTSSQIKIGPVIQNTEIFHLQKFNSCKKILGQNVCSEIRKGEQTLSFSAPTKSNRRVWSIIFFFPQPGTEEHQERFQNQSHLHPLYLLVAGKGKRSSVRTHFHSFSLHNISSLKNSQESCHTHCASMYLGVLLRTNTKRPQLPEIIHLHLLNRFFCSRLKSYWNRLLGMKLVKK